MIDLSARLLAGLVHEKGGASFLRRILPQALPWVTFLPADAVDEFVTELVATLQAAVSIDNLLPVSQVLVEWRHTAEIYADRYYTRPQPAHSVRTADLFHTRNSGGAVQPCWPCRSHADRAVY